MQPYNYVLPNQPGMMDAYAEGQMIQARQAELQAQADDRRMKAEQLKAAMENAKLAQTERERFLGLQNPSAQDVIRFSAHLPHDMVKAMQPQFDALGKEGQQGLLRFGGEVISALQGGRPEIAIDLLKTRASAEKDPQQSAAWNRTAQIFEVSPQLAFKSFAPLLASLPGGKDMLENIDKAMGTARSEELHPGLVKQGNAKAIQEESEATLKKAQAINAVPLATAALEKAQGDAQSAQVAGKYAERKTLNDLEKQGWDIKKIQADIIDNKEKTKIGWLNAKISGETNALKRDELRLKISEMQSDQEKRTRERIAEVTDARRNIDNMLNTADRVLKTPNDVVRAAVGPIDSRVPTAQRDVADFEALIDNMKSQVFLSQVAVMKGLGQLSNTEGQKLESGLQNLSLTQTPEQLVKNVKEIQRLMIKGRDNLATRYGVPKDVPDTPEAQTSNKNLQSLIDKYAPKK